MDIYLEIGSLYKITNNLEKSIEYQNKAIFIEKHKTKPNYFFIGHEYNWMANTYFQYKKFNQSILYSNKSIEIVKWMKNQYKSNEKNSPEYMLNLSLNELYSSNLRLKG